MTNIEIEKNGFEAVIKYEKENGRTNHERVSKCGYDLITKKEDCSDERHIEIKSTSKDKFTFRWLEELEQQALKNDDKFYFYLVTNVGKKNAKVWVYDKEKINSRFSKAIMHYIYVFPKKDFEE